MHVSFTLHRIKYIPWVLLQHPAMGVRLMGLQIVIHYLQNGISCSQGQSCFSTTSYASTYSMGHVSRTESKLDLKRAREQTLLFLSLAQKQRGNYDGQACSMFPGHSSFFLTGQFLVRNKGGSQVLEATKNQPLPLIFILVLLSSTNVWLTV